MIRSHYILTWILLSGNIFNISAQSYPEKRLQFIYIDHEVSTPTATLNERLTSRYYDVVQFPDNDAMVVYLSNGRRSPMSFVNLRDFATEWQLEKITKSGRPRDTEDAFKDVLETMNNANQHDVEPLVDVENILSLLEQFQVFAEDASLNFKSLRFDFYIGPQFWRLQNNVSVIARIYSLIQQGLRDEDKGKISFNVFKPSDSQLDYIEGKPFGDTNLNGINDVINIMEY